MDKNDMESDSANCGEPTTSSMVNNGSSNGMYVQGTLERVLTSENLAEIAIALLESSSSESEDELETKILQFLGRDDEINATDFGMLCERGRRNSIKDYVETTVASYTEAEFRRHFRISRSLFENLCHRFSEWNGYKKLRPDKRLSVKEHLLVFLWFAGHEACCFRDLSDRFNISLWTVCHVIQRVTMFVSSLSPQTIKWPSEEKKENSSKFFATKCFFSKAIGCIDGTHIIIDPPKKSKDEYIDRKGNISVCLQGICDENRKFIDIFVGYPGSCHDSWVLKNSPIYDALPSCCGGDSAYPCNKYLVTPYRDNGHLTAAQKQFNIKLSSGRVRIEHAFGMLKQRFRQLYYCKLRGMEKLCHFIRACCVLHNIANEDDLEFDTDINPESNEEFADHGQVSVGNAVRNLICNELQTNINSLNKT